MNVRLSKKIPLAIAMASVITGGMAAYFSIDSASSALQTAEQHKFQALVSSKKTILGNYLKSVQEDLVTLSTSDEVLMALAEYNTAWSAIEGDKKETLHKHYITDNANPAGQKNALNYAEDGSSYSAVHKKFHPWFNAFLTKKEFYDIFIINKNGDVVYTVFKGLDFATNVLEGEWKDTDIGNAFRTAIVGKAGQAYFFDFKPYAPSNNVPAGFIATPIIDHDGATQGVLVFQMPIGRINGTMSDYTGLGESGETYIVGSDYMMRNDSRFVTKGETSILKTKVETSTVKAALEGKDGFEQISDYRGTPVYSAHTPIEFLGSKFAIIGEVSVTEANAPIISLRNKLLMIVGGIVAVMIMVGALFAHKITSALSNITKAMRKVADGELKTEVPSLSRKDEIGEIAAALQVFKENAQAMEQMQQQEDKNKIANEEQKKGMMRDLANKFEQNVKGVVDMVASAATEMDATSKSVTNVAANNKGKLEMLNSQIAGTSKNVQMVSSATSQLSSAINEISSQIARATTITAAAVEEAKTTDVTVKGLTEASGKIGEVLEMINSIAAQINLLALNATIEAARAGEAGKGFAVVASEVKNLAGQTTKATEQIAVFINSIQGATSDTVSAINSIGAKIRDINAISSTIAAAVEEQGAATRDIANNVQQASTSTEEVARNANDVSAASAETGDAAHEMNVATGELSRQAEILRREVDSFLVGIRA